MHLATSAGIQTGCQALVRAVADTKDQFVGDTLCFIGVNTLGALKEATDDMHGGTPDGQDIAANGIGSGISYLAFRLTF